MHSVQFSSHSNISWMTIKQQCTVIATSDRVVSNWSNTKSTSIWQTIPKVQIGQIHMCAIFSRIIVITVRCTYTYISIFKGFICLSPMYGLFFFCYFAVAFKRQRAFNSCRCANESIDVAHIIFYCKLCSFYIKLNQKKTK